MKKIPLQLSTLALALLLAWPVAAQTPPATKAKSSATGSSGKFELSWSRPETPPLRAGLARLKRVEQASQQGTVPKEEVAQARFEVEELYRHTPYSLTLESHGGSLKELVSAMSGSDEVSFTLINTGEPGDLETSLPVFSLRNVDFGTIIRVIDHLLAPRGLHLTHVGGDTPDPSNAKAVVCILSHTDTWMDNASRQNDFTAVQLAQMPKSGAMSIDNIVGTIRAAWELDPWHDPAALRLKFHPPTEMLLVSGPKQAIVITKEVVEHLLSKPH